MKKNALLIVLLMLLLQPVIAQTLSIDNVQRAVLRNSSAIKEGSEVKGYYFFYISDKIDKHTNEYTLQIIDNNLKKLKDIKFQDSKHVAILESSFNGTDLIFLFYNDDENTFEYKVYGADGKMKHTYVRNLTKKEERFLKQTYLAMDDDEKAFRGLYPIEGKGFISNTPSREDRDYTFEIDYFGTDKRKQWSYTPTEGGKKFVGDYLGTFNGTVFIEILRFGGAFDQKPDSYIVGLDLETGKKVCERATDAKFRFYPASMSMLNEGKAYLFGEYFDQNDNIMKDKSKGFAFWGISNKGEIISEKYVSWDVDMAKYMDVNSKGRIADFGYMFLHNMVQTADGNIFAIGEGFKKAASALGIASKFLAAAMGGSSGISAVKMKVTDMIMLNFDKDFNIKGAKIYEKNSNNIELQSGYEFVSVALMGKMIKYYYGDFDYAYTQVNADNTSFTVCYSDWVRGKDYKGGTFNSITYNEGKFTTDKINTKTDATRSIILPAKQGQVVMVDYYRKQKRIDIHLEKLN